MTHHVELTYHTCIEIEPVSQDYTSPVHVLAALFSAPYHIELLTPVTPSDDRTDSPNRTLGGIGGAAAGALLHRILEHGTNSWTRDCPRERVETETGGSREGAKELPAAR